MTIDQIILERLDALQMSRGALALQMGVSRQAVYGWCDGSSTPKLRRLPALSRALGVDVADLVSCLLSPTAAVDGERAEPRRPCSGVVDGSTSATGGGSR